MMMMIHVPIVDCGGSTLVGVDDDVSILLPHG